MLALSYLILGIYCISLIFITSYYLMQLYLLWHYLKFHKRLRPENHVLKEYPIVTIQLPIFNERYVAGRLIDCICRIDYPKEKMDIQVLDDSTDDTSQISQRKVEAYRDLGYHIRLITREHRAGFKAGALRHGMETAIGEFIAIFDADFLPHADFLKRTIPYFQDPAVGVVQTRWTHLNEDYSLLTRLQAFQLNVHFTIEQIGRQAAGIPLQFNGTAGVWRKSTIEDAGGWQIDTLTEDLDLSYRAQLKGWQIAYLEEVVSPAELPPEMSGLKSQQFRWMKGGAETARKILPLLWNSDFAFSKKILASHHLLSSTVFVSVFLMGISSVPLLFVVRRLNLDIRYFSVALVGLLAVGVVYYVANARTSWLGNSSLHNIIRCVWQIPVFLALSMGLSLHNSIAVMQGFSGHKTGFVRTPKFAIWRKNDSTVHRDYVAPEISWISFFEGILALYFIGGTAAGILLGEYAFLILHLLLMFGYGGIFYFTFGHRRMSLQ